MNVDYIDYLERPKKRPRPNHDFLQWNSETVGILKNNISKREKNQLIVGIMEITRYTTIVNVILANFSLSWKKSRL